MIEQVLFRVNRLKNVKKNHPLYSKITDGRGVAYERIGEWEKAEEIFKDMLARGLQPTVVTFSALISAMQKGGQPERAQELYEDMLERGLKPNTSIRMSMRKSETEFFNPKYFDSKQY